MGGTTSILGPENMRFAPSQDELRLLQLQFDELRTSEGGTVREFLECDAFEFHFADKLPTELIKKLFDALDVNRDGKVSFKEFVGVTHILFAGSEDEKINYLFSLYDTDKDGVLTLNEVTEAMKGSFRSISNVAKAFKLSHSEGLAFSAVESKVVHETNDLAHKLFAEADTNKDGKITLVEFKAYAKKHLDLLHNVSVIRDQLKTVFDKSTVEKISHSTTIFTSTQN